MEDVAYQSGQPIHYPDPIQPGNVGDGLGSPVTRQRGLPPAPQGGIDPQPPKPIVQGDPLVTATRNAGPHVAGRFASDGTFHSDRPADDNILHVDHALSDPESMPPGLARTNAPLPPPSGFGDVPAAQQREAVKAAAIAAGFIVHDAPVEAKDSPTAFDVMQADAGAADPRDQSTGPQVFGADQLPKIKKNPVVPVVLPTPKVRRVKAKKAGR